MRRANLSQNMRMYLNLWLRGLAASLSIISPLTPRRNRLGFGRAGRSMGAGVERLSLDTDLYHVRRNPIDSDGEIDLSLSYQTPRQTQVNLVHAHQNPMRTGVEDFDVRSA